MKVKLPFEPSIPAQEAAIASLDDISHVSETLEVNKKGMEYLYEQFDLLSIKYIQSVANFITIIFENDKKASMFVSLMISDGIILRPLISFGLPNCVRISIGIHIDINVSVSICINIRISVSIRISIRITVQTNNKHK